MSEPTTIVICGGGIIGTSIAYFLSKLKRKELKIVIVERESIACHSSGKAGGFLALDWNDHNEVGPLSRLSYKLHQELATQLTDEKLGYRDLDTYSISARAPSKTSPVKSSAWIDGNIRQKQSIGTKENTSQVHPFTLTHSLMKASDSTLIIDTVIGIENSAHKVRKVRLAKKGEIDADVVVIAMGAWSSQASNFFPLCKSIFKIKGSKAHSIVLEADLPPEALFTHYVEANGRSKEPEIYPRPDGTVYVCGEGNKDPLPENPADVNPSKDAGQKLQYISGQICSQLKEAKVLKEQACYLPCSPDGVPIIGKLPNYQGAYVATGHGCWGILNAPATGKCLAQMILNQELDIDLSPFSPNRFV